MPEIKIYSVPTWPHCKHTKSFLDAHGLQYQDMDITKDATARKEMVDRSGQMGVPVIDIDGELIIGFDEVKLKEKLEIKE